MPGALFCFLCIGRHGTYPHMKIPEISPIFKHRSMRRCPVRGYAGAANQIGCIEGSRSYSPSAHRYSPYAAAREAEVAALATGFTIDILHASSNREIDTSFERLVQNRSAAFLVDSDPLFTSRRAQLVVLSIRHGIPAIFTSREFAEAGGLMSRGANLKDVYRLVGVYTGRILKGERPADLPVVQPTKLEFVINLMTAKTLGLNTAASPAWRFAPPP